MEDKVSSLIDNLRGQCLKRGVGGIRELSVVFRRMDVDFSKRLCHQEFEEGVKAYGLTMSKEDIELLFKTFDTNKNRQIDFLELVSKMRPNMCQARKNVVNQAFDRLDANQNGILELEDLKIVYSSNARKHPKYASGEWTEEQVLRNFLDSIDTPGNPDGKVTREEFLNYYAGVSSTVDDDSYFDLMMRACYGLPNKGEKPK